MKEKNYKGIIIWIFIFLTIVLLMRSLHFIQTEEEIPYSRFKQLLREDKIKEVKIAQEVIRGNYISDEGKIVYFKAIPVNDLKLIEELEQHNVKYSGEPEKGWLTSLIANVGWIFLFFLVWYFPTQPLKFSRVF